MSDVSGSRDISMVVGEWDFDGMGNKGVDDGEI